MSHVPSILIIAFNDLNHDARVSRQIMFLKNTYSVTVACHKAKESNDYKVILLQTPKLTLFKKLISGILLLSRNYSLAYKILYPYEQDLSQSDQTYDLILANDIESLPLAFKVKNKARILFDAHEYAPRQFEEKWVWRTFFQRFIKTLCAKYIPLVDHMLTINQGLAREYAKEYGAQPTIITNANFYENLQPGAVSPQTIKLVHHGAANPSRHLELLIESMKYLDERFTLDLILLTPPSANRRTREYMNTLKQLAAPNPRIKVLPPVPSTEVVRTIHKYDVGLCFIPHVNFNYSHALPNKLFDFVQARLALAIGPTDEMHELVNTYDIGVVCESFEPENLAKHLKTLTADKVTYYKSQSHKAAQKLSAENNGEILRETVRQLLGQ